MQQHCSKYFACRLSPPDPEGAVKRSTFFSEISHAAYQIKGNEA